MQRWIVPLSAALLAVGMSHVASAQGKDQGNGQGQGQGQAQAQEHDHEKDAYKDKDADKVKSNHGQVVSECNHRANSRNLKGQERKDFTEWCESRGPQYKYDENRYGNERNCYQRANDKNLRGDDRANFLRRCLSDVDKRDYGSGKKQKD